MARGKRRSRDELDELSRLLLDLRERAGLRRQKEDVADRLGISQSMVSRFESGRAIPDQDTAGKLAQLYRATPDERARLDELVTAIAPAQWDSRLVMQRGKNLHFHNRIRAIEQSCALVRTYSPGMIVGALQTAAYARVVFTAPHPGRPADADPPESLVAARVARYQQLATDSHRSYLLIQTQAALDWHVSSPAVMAEQMDRLTEASRLPNVRLGIIPARTLSPVFAPHGFNLYDSRAVIIGSKTASALTTEESDIAVYEALFGELERIAVYDDDARSIIARVGAEYRQLGN